MNTNQITVQLLPSIYRKTGWIVIALSLLGYILSEIILGESKYIADYVLIIKCISVIGFLFVMIAKKEFEDERSMALRNKLFAALFVGFVGSYVIANLQIAAHHFIGHNFSIDLNYFIFLTAFLLFIIEEKRQQKEDNQKTE